jgi:vitamin B12 transporter
MFRQILTLGCLASQVAAQTTSLPPILITASRVAESTEETLYSHSVVDREQIERMQARDVAEIIRRLPGVQVGRNGGPGQATSVFVRGAASDHTLVLIDGVPVNSGTVGNAAFQHLMPAQIESIEVVRGPASTLYGSSAIGGVIQIFTRRAAMGPSATLAVEAGSDDTRGYAASLGYGSAAIRANLSASHNSSDGYPVRPSLSPIDRGYRNDSVSGSLGTSIGDVDIDLSHLQAEGNVEYIDFFGGAADHDTRNQVTRLSLAYMPSANWTSNLLLGRVVDRVTENQSADFADTERDYVDWQNTFAVNAGHTFVAGLTGSWTDTTLLSFGSGYDERIRSLEAYLQETREFGETRLQLGGRAIDNEKYGTHFTWKAAVGHPLGASTRGHANIGTAFRAPSANDLYGFGGNPDFEPETSIGGEIGLDHDLGPVDRLRLVGFYSEIDDLIETDPITFTVEQVEQARIYGVEFGYSHQADAWQWALDYTWQDPKNLDLDQQLARRARHTVNASLSYQRPHWWLEGQLRYESERRDSRFSNAMLDEYATVDLRAGYRLGHAVTISGRIENLFDEDYELAASYPAQGRFVGVEFRYDYTAQ